MAMQLRTMFLRKCFERWDRLDVVR